MKTNYHQHIGDSRPKRGDLLQSNGGTARERTWFILAVKVMPQRWCDEMGIEAQRTKLWAERWWDIEPETWVALFRSAERAGGQVVHGFFRFPAKRKAKVRFFQ